MDFISKIIGVIAVLGMLLGLIPFLGWVNWAVLPLAVIGLLFGVFSSETGGRNVNGIVLIVSLLRLILGGGIL